MVKVWDSLTGQELLTLHGNTSGVGPIAFSPSGHNLAIGPFRGPTKIYDATPLPEKP